MEKNNFKLLEQELMNEKEAQIVRVQNNINYNRTLFQSIGDIVELFFPKIIDVFIRMTGGASAPVNNESKYPHEN
jgi:hypothetical protein